MNGVVWCRPAGSKFGNATMSWLHAYAHAQRVGAEFVCDPWIGEKVFNLPAYGRPTKACEAFPERSELNLRDDETNVRITAYAQSELATRLYTKEQAQEWLKPKHDASDLLKYFHLGPHQRVAAHIRRGDYIGYGYPMVSLSSYDHAITKHRLNSHLKGHTGYDFEKFLLVSDLCPQIANGWINDIGDIQFIVDFTILRTSSVLLRANSSFSWVAGLLGTGRVFSPVITPDMVGGREHDCEFVEGNWPRLSCLAGCGDMRLKGET